MSRDSRVRLAIVVDHPIQYFSPAFRYLDASATVRTTVVYSKTQAAGFYDPDFGMDVRWDTDLLSGYRYIEVGPGSRPTTARRTMRFLRNVRPDALLLFGWSDAITRTALAWSVLRRVPALLYGDSTPQHSSTGPRNALQRAQLRLLMRLAAGAFTTGAFNRDFYLGFGMSERDLYEGVLPADTDLYATAADQTSGAGPFTIGFVGKLIERKGVHELIDALSSLSSNEWRALIIGEGPERERLEAMTAAARIADRVDFLGFRNQQELPALVASCDVLVVPSIIDFRVLVVAEAMAAGTPTIVSSNTAVWGRGDLVEHDVTGWVYPSGDPDALVAQIRSLMGDPQSLARIRTAAMERVQAYGPTTFAERIEDAVTRLVSRKR